MKKYMTLFTGVAVALALASTAAVAQQVETAVKFPALKSTYLKTGDFVNLDNLRKVAAGLHKDQVRLLLGNPHFSEGIGNPRVWDYAFNFYTGPMGGDYVTCQYQVQYDKNYPIKATYWKDQQCEGFLREAPPPAAPRVAEPITLSADGLFAFGRSDLNGLQAKGRENLRQLAGQINSGLSKLTSVSIVGYTDRIGSPKGNLALSRARAATVKKYLAQQGVPENLISTSGMGAANPVVNCPGSASPRTIACLMPNRRIEVTLNGEK